MQNNLFKTSFSLLMAVLIFVVPLCGCKEKNTAIKEEIYALNTMITLTVYSDDEQTKAALKEAKDEIYRLENLLSVTNEDSDIYKINSNPDTWVNVSRECFELLKASIEVAENTQGCFDVTVYPAVKLWGFTTSEYKVPTEHELNRVRLLIDYHKIELDESNLSVKIPFGTSLDLGGIAKGYISDKAADVLVSKGVDSALLNFGGNIRLVGSKPEGQSFTVGIKAPFKSGYFATLSLSDKTASTAGGYERYFEENSKRYHHILNPFTASPAESDVLSSTVVGDKGEICDALATSAFISGSEGVAELNHKYPDYGFVLLTNDTVYISQSLSESFELTDDYANTKIKVLT